MDYSISVSREIDNLSFGKNVYANEEFMKITFTKICFIILAVVLVVPDVVWTQEISVPSEEPTLVKAVMCESIQKLEPGNEAIVFSIDLGRVSCFTEFDPVPKQTVIYHKWHRKGRLIAVKQLTINPPRWSSFSSIQLRETDKGPWLVDVTDKNDKLLYTLRFSITD